MSRDDVRRLRMFAGPNGSGKTSLIHGLAREFSAEQGFFRLHRFVNADDLEQALRGEGIDFGDYDLDVTWPQLREVLLEGGRLPADHPLLEAGCVEDSRLRAPAEACDGYAAASIADFVREELVACGLSLSFETVMSHRSKVDFLASARADGYRTYLYFIATDSPELNVGRVQARVALGGHDVRADKIVGRYGRCLDLAREALAHADRAFLFDNSGSKPVWLAEFIDGDCTLKVDRDELPNWYNTSIAAAENR